MVRFPAALFATILVAPTAFSTRAAAQAAPDGYTTAIATLPATVSHLLELPAGQVTFDGVTLQLQAAGQPPRSLLQFATPRFGAFLRPLGNGDTVLLGESSSGELWTVPLLGGAPRLLTNLAFPYDAARLGGGHVVVSAKTGGFAAPDNDLVAVDLQTGAATTIAVLPGASGAVLTTAAGELLYATAPAAFPPPPQSVSVLSFAASQWGGALGGGAPLGATDATLRFAGLDAVGYMALDDDDDLLFTDWLNVTVGEIDDLHTAPARKTLVDYAGTTWFPGWLQFIPHAGATAAAFEPFADHDGALLVLDTDFVTTRLRRTTARTVVLATPAAPVAAGPAPLTIVDGPIGGVALIALSIVAAGTTTSLGLPGVEQRLAWDTALLTPASTSILLLDAQGAATLPLVNPGGLGGLQLFAQAAVLSANADVLGGTALGQLVLGP